MIDYNMDLNAPRVRIIDNAIDILRAYPSRAYPDTPFIDFYRKLKTRYPQLKKYSNIRIAGIIRRFNESIADTAIENKDGVLLPLKTGFIMIVTFNKTRGVVDLIRSMKLGRIVQYSNEHTGGFGGGIFYSAQDIKDNKNNHVAMYENSDLWSFTGSRVFNRKVAKAYSADWKKYNRVDKMPKMRTLDKREFYSKRRHLPNDEFEF